MIEWMVSSSVLILLIIVLRKVLKGKINLCLQYALWGLVMVRLLLPFNIGSSELSVSNWLPEELRKNTPDTSIEAEVLYSGKVGQAWPYNTNILTEKKEQDVPYQLPVYIENSTYEENEDVEAPSEIKEIRTTINWIELWNIIWVTVSILIGSVLITVNIVFAARVKKSRKLLELSSGKLKVYCTEAVENPCLFGLMPPAIYLTPSALENEVALRHILEHEATHHRHRDHIWAILRGACLVVHWYNPLVWWAAVLSGMDAELACDEATVHRIGEQERAEYGRTLIGMTCRKRTSLFVTATTMTGSKYGIKERVNLLVKKPKMATYTLVAVIVLALFAVGCTFTGNKNNSGETDTPQATPTVTMTVSPTEKPVETPDLTTTATSTVTPNLTATATTTMTPDLTATVDITVSPTAAPERTPTPTTIEVLQDQMAVSENVLRFATHSTWDSKAGGDYKIFYCSNQEAAIAALEKAKVHIQENKGIREDDRDSGIYVVYEDEWWMLTKEGALVASGLGRIEAEHTKELVALCEEAKKELNRWGPYYPEDIKGIVRATMFYEDRGSSTITNKERLEKLEQMLSESEPLFGGSTCCFTEILNLELESGKQVTVSMATDSCGVWMSEGVFYRYAAGNEELHTLFTNQEILEMVENPDTAMEDILEFLPYADWSEYCGYYDFYPLGRLLTKVNVWVYCVEELTIEQMNALLNGTNGLGGHFTGSIEMQYSWILRDAYKKNEELFASVWLSGTNQKCRENVLRMMAEEWNMSESEAEKLLEDKASEREVKEGMN